MYGSTIQLPAAAAAAAAEDSSAGGIAAAGLTPVRALLASVPSSTSMDDLSKDIIREELAGDSPRHSGTHVTQQLASAPALRLVLRECVV
jgi:hypothetical protein